MRNFYRFLSSVIVVFILITGFVKGQTTLTYNTAGANTFTVPCGVTSITVECWGGGGGGGFGRGATNAAGGGGGGGAYTKMVAIAVTPGTVINFTVGAAGTGGTAAGVAATAGGTTTFSSTIPVVANGGGFGAGMSVAGNGAGGAGGAGGTFAGGAGAPGQTANGGGGGGGSAGTASAGNSATTQVGAAAVAGGGSGGSGAANTVGGNGNLPGAGGAGGHRSAVGTNRAGGNGGTGKIVITYTADGTSCYEYWFAAPEVTTGHNDAGPTFRFTNTSSTSVATVTVSQPANGAFITTPNTILIPANGTYSLVLDQAPNNFKAMIENTPTNTVLNMGLLINSDVPISAYYEVNNNNNNEIFALKGATALGTEFFIPITLNSPTVNTLYNMTGLTPIAISTFDIVATQNGTTVQIFSHTAVDGHAANIPFSITLNRGQTYSCGWSGANYDNPAFQPSGAVVLSDKPIAITVKEDSKRHTGFGCYDLIGDQLVPVDIVGTDYIIIKGQLTAGAGESYEILATQNNTNVYVDGNATPVATLFAGQTYFQDNITNPRYYIHTDKPVYCIQISGFGCELGSAILPPLNCAGSRSVSFVRSTAEAFYLNIMVRDGSQGNFTLTGGDGSNPIVAADFAVVPGTGGEWYSTYGKNFDVNAIPVGTAMRLSNSTDKFGLGLINGDAATGCRYGFFSDFAARIFVDAGPNQTICGNKTAVLNGTISGGATTGIWTTSGTGSFVPNATTLNATYVPSTLDTIAGSVILTLTSTSDCFPISDQMTITITDAPWITAGPDASVCRNNPVYPLDGHVSIAGGAQWSGGSGTFLPNNLTLNATYTPTAAELLAGNATLTLTSVLNGTCNAVSDNIIITYTDAPTANAGPNFSVCANNPAASLSGSVTIATGGTWSGGSGTYNPNNTTLNATYTPSAAEITAGSVTLTLTTTGNGTCIASTDQVTILITPSPTANAGLDRTVCANNANLILNGSVTVATGGTWSGGLGLYAPNNATLNATYSPTALEIMNGSVTLTLTTSGNGNCNSVNDPMIITIGPAPIANAGIDQSVCYNNPAVTLNGSVIGATGGTWSGGSGTYAPNANTLNAVYTPSLAERTAGTATLTLTSSGNGSCNAVTDQMIITITPAPVVNAGVNKTVCANNCATTINATITGATGGTWSGGTGAYNPSNTALNVIYTPSAAEISAGSVTLTLTSTGNGNCNAVVDQMLITITPAPTVSAGPDRSVCANNSAVTLAGSVIGATGGTWSGGLGTFAPNANTLNATYTPSAGEVIAGTVTLTLTSTGNGTCNPVPDQMVITITPAPTANAGLDQSVCFNNSATTLAGVITGATGGQWSGGTGVYNPSNTTLNAIYTPSAAERAAGTVTLTLTSTGNATCNAVTDQMTIDITPAPIVNAGTDKTVCANNPATTINASITGATGGIWSGGTGAYNPGNTALSIIYTPSAAEIAAGTVNLTLTSTGNANCNAVIDQTVITITPAPIVNAGTDRSVCANNNNVILAGSVTGATGGTWSGGLGTYSPNANALNATYTPSAAEITAGTTTLTLTSTGNGLCNSMADQMTIAITPAPIVNAGINQTVCANNSATTLNGAVTGATGGTWSGGTGSYSPNANALNAVYTPSAAERLAGIATLTLTSTGNGNCNSVSDQMTINITPAPTANAGIDKSVCANNTAVTINGNVTIATGGLWSGGTGSYNPANTALSIIYTPSAGEISAGTVTLTLTTTGNGTCSAASDAVVITITPAPIVNAGIDRVVCANNSSVILAGTVTGATGGLWSGGLGTFSPDVTNLNATYIPSAGEIATGTVNLTLSSTGNGTCNSVSDQMNITITPGPTANAGTDITVGANNPNAALNGIITIASGGSWSGGTGTYSPNNNTLNAIYTPSAAEITAGGLDLTLTTTGNGSCSPVSDIVHITITASPVVNAGVNQTSCANNSTVTLNGTVSGATGGQWSGGTGTYTPNNTTLNAVYAPSAAEIAAGTVTLTLTSTGNGPCNPVTDQMIITITPSPVANAGIDRTVCSNNATVLLNGTVTGATGGQWTGGLGFYNPNGVTLNASYTPTLSEISTGSLTLTLTTTGNGACNAVTDQMTITFTPSPTSNANSDQTVCGNNSNVTLNGAITVATGGIWSGGSGTYNPNSSTLNAVYTPTAGEIATGLVTLTLTTTGNGTCNSVNDNMIISISPAPVVNAGSNLNSCVNSPAVTLNGSVINAGGGQWSGTTGIYNPGNTTMNAVYTPSAAEIAAGSVTLTLTSTLNGSCLAVTDQMTINIGPAPIVNAGSDQVMCANNFNIQLNGSVTGATGGQWVGGLGLFTPNNNTLNAVYTPTMGEIASGTLTLTLSSTGNGACTPVSDNMIITFTPAPTVDAGADQIVCANTPTITLNGGVTIASGGTWTGGNGTFVPNNLTLNATYTPSATEIALGTVTLTLTSTGNGNCIPVSDQMTLIISNAPIVNAGPDLTSCANNPTVTLNGNYMYAGGSIWSGGTGTYNPNNTTLNATYTPSAAEITAGTATLTLTTTGNGSCNAAIDNIVITINPSPIVNAGTDLIACGNNPTLTLNGSVVGASGGTWSGGLGSFLPNNSVLNATYTPSAPEVLAGTVTLTLTTTGNGTCNAVTDQVTITYTAIPVANAGVNQTLCANNPDITLNGSISTATGGIWSGGLGTYNPNNTTLNATYTPTASEISDGYVDLTLITTGNGQCLAVTDQAHFTITPAPSVIAGPDQITCVDDLLVDLNGFVAGVTTTGIWSSSGSGSFTPNASTLNAVYHISSADSTAGTVTLTLTSTGNGNCLPVTDELEISILPAGLSNAGPDQTVCGNNANSLMAGIVGGGATAGTWSSSGSGVFVPTNTALNAVYIPSQTDTAIGLVTLTLIANSCNMAQDQMNLTITAAPFVNAGVDVTVCVDNLDIPLNGMVGGASNTGIWSTSGTGTFTPDNTTLNAVYHASSLDSINEHIILTLTATNIGTCTPVSDNVEINILPPGIVNAGFDQTFCANNATINLSGSITGGASEGIWATSGSGTFIPNNIILNPIYIPSSADTATGSVTLALTATNSCNFAMDILQVSFTPAPWISAGPDQSICLNNPNVTLSGIVSIATGGSWATAGTGVFSPSGSSLNTTYIPSAADKAAGSVTLIITSTGNGGCSPVTDTLHVTFTPSPLVNAGIDQNVCSSSMQTQLHGAVSGGATTGVWTTSGTGTFSPDSANLNATYIFSSADTLSGSVTLTLTSTNYGNCLAVTNDMTITFGNSAFVDAGLNITACESNLSIPLTGFISGGSSTGTWSSSGTGTFSPNDSALNAVYICSPTDSILGSVDIFLTSTHNGGCQAGFDTTEITIEKIPTVNAGANQAVCITSDHVSLNGIATNTLGYVWTSNGTGNFVPDNTTLNALYYQSSNDSLNGTIQLTLSSTGNLACNSSTDNITVTFKAPSIASAGSDVTACVSNLNIPLTGTITGGTTTGAWSTNGTGTFIPNNTTLNATYVCSNIDSLLGIVTLTLNSTNNGGCSPSMDSIYVTIESIPQISAGADQFLCTGVSFADLDGTASNTPGILWTTNGTGTFLPDGSTLNSFYFPSLADSLGGSVQITLTSVGQSACPIASDIMQINFTSPSNVIAGPDITVCVTNMNANLNGTVNGGAGTGIWSTSGTGSFNPNSTTLNASYIPSSVDSILGSVTLTLTATGSGGCPISRDSLELSIIQLPVVNAGPDQDLCSSVSSVTLNGTISNGIAGTWTTAGSGSFSPNDTTVNADYIPSLSDLNSGSVFLILTSNNMNGCASVNDTVVITFITPVQANFTYTTGCQNLPITFNDNSIINNGTINNWLWDFGMGITADTSDTTFTFTTTGIHNVTLTVTSSIGCDFSITKAIYINPVPVANFNYSTECYLDSVQFNDISTVENGLITLWSWNFSDGGTSNLQTPNHIFMIPDTFNVSLTVTSDSGCTGTSVIPTIIYPLPNASFSYYYSCNTHNVYFSSTSTSAGDTISSWNWHFNGDLTSTTENPIINYPVTGTYPVTLSVGTSQNCMDTITSDINVYGVKAEFNYVNACLGSPVNYVDASISGGGAITSWTWDFGDGGSGNTQNPSHAFISGASFTTQLIVQTDSGCIDSISHIVTIYPSPQASFTFNATDMMAGEPIHFTDASTGANNWSWVFGDSIGSSSMQNPSYIYSSAGSYTVIQYVTNEYDCLDSAYQNLNIKGKEEAYAPVLPTGFTPNADNNNDILYVRGGPFIELEFRVFNEWGKIIFESTDASAGWDGTYKGLEQPVGVYVYTVKATTVSNKNYKFSGEVTLIR